MGSDGNSVDNYQLVDEYPYNTTDYVGSLTTGAKDTYDFANLVKTGNVIAVSAPRTPRRARRARSSSASCSAEVAVAWWSRRTSRCPPPTCQSRVPIWTTDGDGSPWTVARVNASQFGFKVI